MSNVDFNNPVVVNPLITSGLRQAGFIVGTWLAGHGFTAFNDQYNLQLAVGVLMVMASSAWAFYTRRKAGIIADAAAQPDVEKIVTDKQTANVTFANNSKVVAGGKQ